MVAGQRDSKAIIESIYHKNFAQDQTIMTCMISITVIYMSTVIFVLTCKLKMCWGCQPTNGPTYVWANVVEDNFPPPPAPHSRLGPFNSFTMKRPVPLPSMAK